MESRATGDETMSRVTIEGKGVQGFPVMRLVALLLLLLPALFGEQPLSKAEELYQQTDYQASLGAVRALGHPDSAGYCLRGQDYFMLGDYKEAAEAFEKAFALEPRNSEYAHWLAKSFARRAETSSLFLGSRDASKARAYFEKAVALDPNNKAALNDLFDFYLEAPGFSGEGYDKAEAIARRISARNPVEGQFAEARVADRRRQFDTADEQLRRAIDVTGRKLDRVLNLARYLAQKGRIQESEAAFDQAERLAPSSPKVVIARARVYVEQRRNLDRAKILLTKYLQSNLTPDASREQAEKLLKEASGA
jgi:cytochrome c-type biogenesis protein CcmH/NrfG